MLQLFRCLRGRHALEFVASYSHRIDEYEKTDSLYRCRHCRKPKHIGTVRDEDGEPHVLTIPLDRPARAFWLQTCGIKVGLLLALIAPAAHGQVYPPPCVMPILYAYVQDTTVSPYTVGFTCTYLAAIPALQNANCPPPTPLPVLAPGQSVALYASAAGIRVASPPDSGYPWEYAVANVTQGAPQPILPRWTGYPIGPSVQVVLNAPGIGVPLAQGCSYSVVQSPAQTVVTVNCS